MPKTFCLPPLSQHIVWVVINQQNTLLKVYLSSLRSSSSSVSPVPPLSHHMAQSYEFILSCNHDLGSIGGCGVAPPVPSPLHLAQLTSIRPWDLSRQQQCPAETHRRQRDRDRGRGEINREYVKSICSRSVVGQDAAAVTSLIWLARPDADLTTPADVLWREEMGATHARMHARMQARRHAHTHTHNILLLLQRPQIPKIFQDFGMLY